MENARDCKIKNKEISSSTLTFLWLALNRKKLHFES